MPLVELCVLVGIVLLVLGALDLDSDRGKLMLVLGMALGSLGGLDTALREHLAGYRSHTTIIAALPAVIAAAALYFAGAPWPAVIVAAVVVFAGVLVDRPPGLHAPRAPRPGARLPYPVSDEKRMQLRGLHHVTAICRDLERTIAFYRDLLGLAIVHDGPSDDDPESRHVWFGALDGGPASS